MADNWQYVAQRARTNEFLDWDVPLTTPGPSWVLSGAGALSATVPAALGRLRAADGRLVLEEWGTLLYAVVNDEIRWGGIVISSAFNETGEWAVEAAGFATYPHGLHYDNARTWTQVSPVEPFRELWANAQWRPNARLGVTVISDDIGARVGYRGTSLDAAGNNNPVAQGDVDDDQWAELLLAGWTVGADKRLYPPARVYRSTLGDVAFEALVKDKGYRPDPLEDLPRDTVLKDGVAAVKKADVEAASVTWLKAHGWADQKRADGDWLVGPPFSTKPQWADPPVETIAAAPYSLAWWESPDIGTKLDDLASTTPFDWVERHFWVPLDDVLDADLADPDVVAWCLQNGWTSDPTDGDELLYRPPARPKVDEVAHVIRISWPRTGRRRDDLVFIEGDNVIKAVTPTLDGDEYANSVTGLGAGEGIAALRREIAVDDGRLYRAALWTDKSITDSGVLQGKIQGELLKRQNLLEITSITVRDHANARLGSWALGDDILVQATVPQLGEIDLWCRVTGWSLDSADTATLTLARSDSFRYGG